MITAKADGPTSVGRFSEILTATFLNYSFSFAYPLLSLILVQTHSFSIVNASYVLALAFLASAICQTRLGALLDNGYIKHVIVGSSLLTVIGITGVYLTSSSVVWAIASAALFLVGFNSIATVTSLFMEGLVSNDDRGRLSLVYASTTCAGFFMSSVLAYLFLKNTQGWLLFFDGISTIVLGLALYRYANTIPVSKAAAKHQRSVAILPLILERKELILGVLLIYIGKVASFSIIPLTYTRFHSNGEQLTIVMFATNDLLIFASGFLFKDVIDRISSKLLILGFLLFSGAGLAIVPFVQGSVSNVIATSLWTFGEVLAYPFVARMIFKSFSDDEAGAAAGIKSFLLRLAMAIGPVLVAVSATWNKGSLSLLFALVPIFGCVLLLRQKQLLAVSTPNSGVSSRPATSRNRSHRPKLRSNKPAPVPPSSALN